MSNAEFKKYPVYQYIGGKIIKLKVFPEYWNIWEWQLHHYVKQQQVRRNPELEKIQKLFFLPTQMHIDLHNCISNFKEKYGVSRRDLMYGAKYE